MKERINCRETVVNDGRKAINVERRREEGTEKKNKRRETCKVMNAEKACSSGERCHTIV